MGMANKIAKRQFLIFNLIVDSSIQFDEKLQL
jgi:hypothetical protein